MNKLTNTVKNLDTLKKMCALYMNPEEGMIMFCEEENTNYIYHNGEWTPISENATGLNMTLYDMNAQLISQNPAYTDAKKAKAKELITAYANEYEDAYFMLLCKEQSYYTVFRELCADNEFKTIGDAVITICEELGTIHDVYPTTEGTIDIWVKVAETVWCLHLFPYDAGVIYYG